MRLKILLFLVLPAIGLGGCNVINPVEDIPTYIKIDSFNFKINDPGKEGSAAHGITTAWIYYNNNIVGAFDLPCKVPIITSGNSGVLSIRPGIPLNGLVDLQPAYNFYDFDTVTLVSNPGRVQEYTPTARYFPITKFNFKEDFEIGNSFLSFHPEIDNDTTIRRTTKKEDVFEGGGSGIIELSTAFPTSESISNTGFAIPQGESFIEINYKGNVNFEVGLYNTLENNVEAYKYFWGVKSSDGWKKIYIELATYTGEYKGKDHKVIIKAVLPDGQSTGYVSIDNIKVVSY